MKINDNNSIRGIFKYSDDVCFEDGDFVVDGNCIYICTVNNVTGERPSLDTEHLYYSEYPGNKIVSASEYYDYVNSENRGVQIEDKYVSAHSLCEILENMYFGFGDNGILTDHILYNPNTGIEYSVRGVHRLLDYSNSSVLNEVLKTPDLNNGFIRISRNLPELNTLLLYDTTAENDVVVLKQYTYLDSEGTTPYRVQELLDPEKNRLYFRFAKGLSLEGGGFDFSDSIASKWKSLYGDDADVQEMLDTVREYWRNKVEDEYEQKLNRMQGRYCYRSVDASEYNHLGTNNVYLYPGETRDIKSIEDFTSGPCMLDILIKVPVDSNVFRNYSITIDTKDTVDLGTETYYLDDNITLETTYSISGNIQCIQLYVSVSEAIIKDIYYRDKTLNHVHEWKLYTHVTSASCTEPGEDIYECIADGCPLDPPRQKRETVAPLGHRLAYQEAKDPTCTQYGWYEYWYCDRCQTYFKDEHGTIPYPGGWNGGGDQVKRPELGGEGHQWSGWHIRTQATCTTPGIKVRTCTICGAEDTETIPALGHDMVKISGQSATCGEFGHIEHYHCRRSRCGKDFEDLAGNHELSEEDLKIYPSGNHTILHDVSQADVIQESTYSDYPNVDDPNPVFGLGYVSCETCRNKIKVSLPLKQHDFHNTPQHELIGGNASYSTSTGKHYPAYTEGLDGNERHRNYDFNPDIPIIDQLNNHIVDHNLAEYTEPTCNEYGFWKGTCTLCGADDVIERDWNHPPTGHTVTGNDRVWEKNTCTTDAEWVGRCSVCNSNNVHAIDENHLAIGHRDEDGDNKCDECGDILTNNV